MKAPVVLKKSFLPIFTGSDLSTRKLPRISIQGKKPGPTIWITGCIHGDEVGGMVVIQELMGYLKKNPLTRGTVHTIPLMNPVGFESGTRNVPLSGDTMYHENLNRAFPGSKDGSVTERIAHTIFTAITKTNPALVIDLHNDWNNSIPYVLLDPPSQKSELRNVFKEAQRIAHTTTFPVINEEESRDDRDDLRRSLSGSMSAHGIPSFTMELGPAYVVKEEFVSLGLQSLINILVSLEMLPPQPLSTYPVPKKFAGKLLRYSHSPRASKSGVVRFIAKPGMAVKEGDPIARIYNSFGELEETVLAKRDALVLGHTDYSVAFPGMVLYAFAY